MNGDTRVNPLESLGFTVQVVDNHGGSPEPQESVESSRLPKVKLVKVEGDKIYISETVAKVADAVARLTFPLRKAIFDFGICSIATATKPGNKMASLSARASLAVGKQLKMGPDALDKTGFAGSLIGRTLFTVFPGTIMGTAKGLAVSAWNLLTLKSTMQAYRANSAKDLSLGLERYYRATDKVADSFDKVTSIIDEAVEVRKLQLGTTPLAYSAGAEPAQPKAPATAAYTGSPRETEV